MRALACVVVLALFLGGCQEPDQPIAAEQTAVSPSAPSVPAKVQDQAYHPSPAMMEEAASGRSSIVGKPAPDFTLMDQDNRPVTVGKLRGQWVVLYFYPKDDTPGCACQATEFTQLLTQFKDMNAKVYGISTDSVASHQTFVKKYSLKLDLLSDGDHAAMEAYGAWVNVRFGSEQYSRIVRSTVIVGPDGTVRYHWPEVIPEGHAERVRQKLAEIQRG